MLNKIPDCVKREGFQVISSGNSHRLKVSIIPHCKHYEQSLHSYRTQYTSKDTPQFWPQHLFSCLLFTLLNPMEVALGPISFIFMKFSTKIFQITGWHSTSGVGVPSLGSHLWGWGPTSGVGVPPLGLGSHLWGWGPTSGVGVLPLGLGSHLWGWGPTSGVGVPPLGLGSHLWGWCSASRQEK